MTRHQQPGDLVVPPLFRPYMTMASMPDIRLDVDLRIRIPASLAGYFPLIYGIEGRGFRELSPTFVKPSIRGPLLVRQLSG